jgi:hypothetical protein
MIITGIIMFVVGVLLINFLQPQEDVRRIQLLLLPKIIALLITIGGILVFLIGLLTA